MNEERENGMKDEESIRHLKGRIIRVDRDCERKTIEKYN